MPEVIADCAIEATSPADVAMDFVVAACVDDETAVEDAADAANPADVACEFARPPERLTDCAVLVLSP